jgi:hypothetical protein
MEDDGAQPSVEDRKRTAKLRIAKLQAQKLDKTVVGAWKDHEQESIIT